MTEKISEKEINKNKISGLPVRPNDGSSYGSGNLNAAQLRAKFDALPLLIIERLNALIDSIGDGSEDGLAAAIPTGIDEKSLSELFSDIMNGALASYFGVISKGGDLSTLQSELEYIYGALGDDVGGRVFGKECYAGARGYYYKSIDLTGKKIYLSASQVRPVISAVDNTDPDFPTPEYSIGSTLAIINNNKYFPGAKIVSVSGNVIKYSGELGFTSINTVDSVNWSADDYAVFCIEEPERGMFELKHYGLAAGFLCYVLGNSGVSFGTGNLTYGDHGFTYNYGNKAAWAASAGGYGNESNGFYSDTTGRDNINDAECGRMAGRGNKSGKSAYGSDISGLMNEGNAIYLHMRGRYNWAGATATASDISGEENKVTPYCVHMTGAGNTADSNAEYADISGKENYVGGKFTHVSGLKNTIESSVQKTQSCSVSGEGNKVIGAQNANVHGKQNTIKGSTASGQWGGSQSDVGGLNNTLDGTNTGATNVHLHGEQNLAKHRNADVCGKGNRSSAVNQIVRGTFCADDPNALLIVGNGTSDAKRSNAFVVKKNGDVYMLGKKLATVEYADEIYSRLVNSAPEMLDTLDELSAALGDDANFSATVMGMIAENRKKSEEIENWIKESTTFDPSDAGKVLVISDTGQITVQEFQNQKEDIDLLIDLIEGDIAKIAIPAGVTKIRDHAFSGCTALRNVIIPEGVEEIGYSAFSNCSSLESLYIPDSVKTVDSSAFSGCHGVKVLIIGDGLKDISAFKKNEMAGYYNTSKIKTVEIGNGVEEIPYDMFISCTELVSVKLGANVKKIESNAFKNCTSLCNLEIPDLLETCEENFASCPKLSFTIEDGGRYLGSENNPYLIFCGLEDQENISSFEIKQGCRIVAAYAFDSCNLERVTVPEGVISIGSYAFTKANIIEEIILPSTIEKIGKYIIGDGYCNAITLHATVPPQLESNSMYEGIVGPYVYVPPESVEAYENATNWSYEDIRAIGQER